jgi:hypothetical protein
MNFYDPAFCRQAADYLRTLPGRQYVGELRTFFSGGVKEPCGTIACAAGHLVISPLNESDRPRTEDMARQAQKKGLKAYDWRSGS